MLRRESTVFRRFIPLLVVLLAACESVNPAPRSLSLPNQLIAYWETASGSLGSADEIQPYQFVGVAGDNVRAQVVGAVGARLTLQTADGTRLVADVNPLEAVLPADGVYTLLVQANGAATFEVSLGYSDRVNPADYTATPVPVTPTATPTVTPTPPYYARFGTFIDRLAGGENRQQNLTIPEDRHVYTFEGRAGDYVTVLLGRTGGEFDPILRVYAPEGIEIASDDDTGGQQNALVRDVRLAVDGTYSIQVWGKGLVGSYEVVLLVSESRTAVTPYFAPTASATAFVQAAVVPTVQAAISGQTLEDHVPVLGRIERVGDFDRYPFEVTQGDLITVGLRVESGSGLAPRLELYDPEGSLVAVATPFDSNAEGDALIPALLAAQNGTYTVFVTGERNTTGGYIVSYGIGFSREDVPRVMTIPDQLYSGELGRRGQRDVWMVELNAGDVISAAVQPLGFGLDPLLQLVAPDGTVVAADDNGGGGRDALIGSARAAVSGVYGLKISAVNAAADGPYTLVWRIVNRAATATPPPGIVPVLSVADRVPENTYLFYTFYGEAGMTVEVQVIADVGSGFDPVAALLLPDGRTLAEGDDGPADLNPRFVAMLPVDGTYRVRVNGYLSSGAFRLTVNALYSAS